MLAWVRGSLGIVAAIEFRASDLVLGATTGPTAHPSTRGGLDR